MQTFNFVVSVRTDNVDHARTVMTERLGPDEDYGFDYQITDWGLEKGSSDLVETQDRLTLHAAEAHGLTDEGDRDYVIAEHERQHEMTERISDGFAMRTEQVVYQHSVEDLYLYNDEDGDTTNADEQIESVGITLIGSASAEKDDPPLEDSSDRVSTQGTSPSPAGSSAPGAPEFDIAGSLLAELDGALKRATAIANALNNEVGH